MLLSSKIDLISEERGCKKNVLGVRETGYIKKVYGFFAEIVAFYVRPFIVHVEILALSGLSWGAELT